MQGKLNRFAGMFVAVWLLALSFTARAQLPDFVSLVEKNSPSVVHITTVQEGKTGGVGPHRVNPEEMFDFFRRMVPPDMERNMERFAPPRRGEGSGFFISSDGDILTNAHVVEGADEVVVKLSDRREFRAKVLGVDSRTDVALVRIEAGGLPAVRVGNPAGLRVGEWVLAIGAPFGFENSATAGIVSAKGRMLPDENYVPFIQTDVAVNPGNSGGPLFNLQGEVVGMNSQIISKSGGYMGLSFAIPIDVAMRVADQLKRTGKVARGRLGVLVQELSADLAESFGLERARGALVAEVEPGGPADRAGVKQSDIVLALNGQEVTHSIDLPRMVGMSAPGSQVRLTVWRGRKPVELTATLDALNDREAVAEKESNPAGLVVESLNADARRALGVKSGVRVENASGAAARAGIRPGDVILTVNNQDIHSAADLRRQLNEGGKKSAALLVRRGNRNLYIALRLE